MYHNYENNVNVYLGIISKKTLKCDRKNRAKIELSCSKFHLPSINPQLSSTNKS